MFNGGLTALIVNEGEKSEKFLKAYLLRLKFKNDSSTVFRRITSLSDDGNLSSLVWKNSAQDALDNFNVEELENLLKIGKTKTSSKADLSVNNISYSLKEISANPPAIVNHTTRPGFETACNHVNSSINELDNIISKYWSLRKAGLISEDTKTSDTNCPFNAHKDYLKPIIEYFLFTGSGRGPSEFPAEKILEIDYHNLPDSIEIFERDDYFEKIWSRLVFSLRSKSMPKKYPKCDNSESISIWTCYSNGKNKGALHIRVR